MNCDYFPYQLPRKQINGALSWGNWCGVAKFVQLILIAIFIGWAASRFRRK
jgi:hypothetical protein